MEENLTFDQTLLRLITIWVTRRRLDEIAINMYVIIWEYEVKAEHLIEFERIYASNGIWAELFKKHAGYLGTELLHDIKHPQRYITVDRWVSSEAYELFHEKWQDEYNALDARCKNLTDQEVFLGSLLTVQPEE